jgi:hypothetical protein
MRTKSAREEAFVDTLGQHLLNHQGVDIHETDLQQVERQHQHFLVLQRLCRKFCS